MFFKSNLIDCYHIESPEKFTLTLNLCVINIIPKSLYVRLLLWFYNCTAFSMASMYQLYFCFYKLRRRFSIKESRR